MNSLLQSRPTPTPLVNLREPEFPELVHVCDYHSTLPCSTSSPKVVELVRFQMAARSWYKRQQHQKVIAKVETDARGVYGYVCFERDAETRLKYNTLRDLVSGSSPSIDFAQLLDSLIEDGLPISEACTIFHMKRVRESLTLLAGDDDGDEEDSRVDDSPSPTGSGSPCPSEAVSNGWTGLGPNAEDRVSRLCQYPGDICVKRVETLKPTNLHLCDLAVLVASVHDLNAVYSIFHAQRFWFANLIMRIVEKDHHQDTIEADHAHFFGVGVCCGRRENNGDEVCSAAGRWYNVRVSETLLVVVEMVRVQYQERRRRMVFYGNRTWTA